MVWRGFALQRRAFNTRNASGGNDDYVCSARRGLEHGEASIKADGDIDLEAGKGDANALVGWQTDVMYKEPQLAAVGCRGKLRLTYSHGGGEDCDRDERATFEQMESDPKICLAPNIGVSSLAVPGYAGKPELQREETVKALTFGQFDRDVFASHNRIMTTFECFCRSAGTKS